MSAGKSADGAASMYAAAEAAAAAAAARLRLRLQLRRLLILGCVYSRKESVTPLGTNNHVSTPQLIILY